MVKFKRRIVMVVLISLLITLFIGCFDQRPDGNNLVLEKGISDEEKEEMIVHYEYYHDLYYSNHELTTEEYNTEQDKLIDMSSTEPRDDLYNIYMSYMYSFNYLRSILDSKGTDQDVEKDEEEFNTRMTEIYLFLVENFDYEGKVFPKTEE